MSGFVWARNDPDLAFVFSWFEFQIALLGASRAAVLEQKPPRAHELRFTGFTLQEVETFFDQQRQQLELVTMLELLTTAEAIIRNDFEKRVTARKKDPLSKRFREISTLRGPRIRLDEDILANVQEALKVNGSSVGSVADFRGALKLRNWLAHGRHWNPKLGRQYSPEIIFDISRKMIDSTPAPK